MGGGIFYNELDTVLIGHFVYIFVGGKTHVHAYKFVIFFFAGMVPAYLTGKMSIKTISVLGAAGQALFICIASLSKCIYVTLIFQGFLAGEQLMNFLIILA